MYETSEAIVPLRNIGFRGRNRTDVDKIMSLTWEANTLPEWSKQRELNSHLDLGKVVYYHCTMPTYGTSVGI